MSKLDKDEACQFVDACSDWLAKILCDTAFAIWRYSYNYVRVLFNKYGLLNKCEVKMAGYWPSSFFACLWTETNINSQKKNEANIQPS